MLRGLPIWIRSVVRGTSRIDEDAYDQNLFDSMVRQNKNTGGAIFLTALLSDKQCLANLQNGGSKIDALSPSRTSNKKVPGY